MLRSQARTREPPVIPQDPVALPFQRLLIYYPGLPEICGCKHDESCSLEELTEQILYYYDSGEEETALPASPETETKAMYATEKAAQFMGVCSALYTFPGSFEETEKTQEILFSKYTLVFCVVEAKKIIAVAQTATGNPQAIRSSLEQSHLIFCLLRGGGIIPRLLSRPQPTFAKILNAASADSKRKDKSLTVNNEDDETYPGMTRMYELRRQERKIRNVLSKTMRNEAERGELGGQLEEIMSNIMQLTQVLPITILKRDLKSHYDGYLSDEMTEHRCLVEMSPRPRLATAPKISPSPAACIRLGYCVRSLLESSWHCREPPLLLAISSFYRGKPLYTHVSEGLKIPEQAFELTTETVCGTMRYLMHFEQNVQHGPGKRRESLPLIRDNINEYLQNSPLPPKFTGTVNAVACGHYLPPPPLSMLNISDELSEIDDAILGKVWTPVVFLPRNDTYVPVHVALFSLSPYNFLIFLDFVRSDCSSDAVCARDTCGSHFSADLASGLTQEVTSQEVQEQSPEARLLCDISVNLSMCVNDLSAMDSPRSDENTVGTGMDIIFVDRKNGQTLILPGMEQKKTMSGRRVNELKRASDFDAHSMDIRHQLLSRMPLGMVYALDDMMNEIHRSELDIELCSYLPEGWLWAASCGHKELYVAFDSMEHTTITDVQKNTEQLRERFFTMSTK